MKLLLTACVAVVPLLAHAGLVFEEDTTPAAQQFVPVAPKPEWRGLKGDTVEQTLRRWAKDEWTIVYDTATQYELLAPVRFEGDFDDAVAQFISLYSKADIPLDAQIQKEQRVVYITSRGGRK